MSTADALTRAGSTGRRAAAARVARCSPPGSSTRSRWPCSCWSRPAYLTGVALVPVRSPGERWPVRRTASFLAGLGVCGFATNGSIAVYDQVLFTAHMAGHLALVMVAPALLVAGRPLLLLLASPPARRARLERVLRGRVGRRCSPRRRSRWPPTPR